MAMWRFNSLVIVLDGVGDLKPEMPVKLDSLLVVNLDMQIDFHNVGIILAKIQCILQQLRACATQRQNVNISMCKEELPQYGISVTFRCWTEKITTDHALHPCTTCLKTIFP